MNSTNFTNAVNEFYKKEQEEQKYSEDHIVVLGDEEKKAILKVLQIEAKEPKLEEIEVEEDQQQQKWDVESILCKFFSFFFGVSIFRSFDKACLTLFDSDIFES